MISEDFCRVESEVAGLGSVLGVWGWGLGYSCFRGSVFCVPDCGLGVWYVSLWV